jgi:hypothetical protein
MLADTCIGPPIRHGFARPRPGNVELHRGSVRPGCCAQPIIGYCRSL